MFPGESPGRSRLALLGRRYASGGPSGMADYGHVTIVNHFYNAEVRSLFSIWDNIPKDYNGRWT